MPARPIRSSPFGSHELGPALPSVAQVQQSGLTARNLYTYYKADIYAYVMVMQNINRELCRRLRRADNRIAELADASRGSMTQNRVRPVG